MANPYIVGSPVAYSHLYGRDDLIQSCYQDVNNNIWLLGRRRSGKTSILHAIEKLALERKEWFPVYITLEICFSDADIRKSFLRGFRKNLNKFELEAEYQPPAEEHDFVDSVDEVCRWLNERDIGLLLLLDEIEQIEVLAEEGRRLEAKLRGINGRSDLRLRTIISAARVLRTHKMVTSPFIGLFRIEYIGAISKPEAKNLILQEKNAEMKIQVADRVIDEILEKTSSEPYLIQYLCHELYDEDNSLRTPTNEDLTQLNINLSPILAVDYGYLEEDEQKILSDIAQGKQIDSVPDELIRLGYIKQISGQYRIGNHFLETWLQKVRPEDDSTHGEEEDEPPSSRKLSKPTDLLVSILLATFGLGLIMGEYAILIRNLSNFQSVLVGLVTAILGFAVLIFAGRSIDIIGETTFFKLFSQIIEQIPLLSKLITGKDEESA